MEAAILLKEVLSRPVNAKYIHSTPVHLNTKDRVEMILKSNVVGVDGYVDEGPHVYIFSDKKISPIDEKEDAVAEIQEGHSKAFVFFYAVD